MLKSESRPIKPRGNNKVGRMSLSNPDKIARRAERKELKRQKRAEARQVAGQQSSPPQSSPEKEAGSLHGVWKAADTPARSGAGAFGLCSPCLDCVPFVWIVFPLFELCSLCLNCVPHVGIVFPHLAKLCESLRMMFTPTLVTQFWF